MRKIRNQFECLEDEVVAGIKALPCNQYLTDREFNVLMRIAQGLSNQQIADEINVKKRTIERNITTLYLKLGLNGDDGGSRVKAALYVIERAGLSMIQH